MAELSNSLSAHKIFHTLSRAKKKIFSFSLNGQRTLRKRFKITIDEKICFQFNELNTIALLDAI
jgi:hypothetical protein